MENKKRTYVKLICRLSERKMQDAVNDFCELQFEKDSEIVDIRVWGGFFCYYAQITIKTDTVRL
jgi:hypothetical protein